MNAREIADALNVSPAIVRGWIRQGVLRGQRVGRDYQASLDDASVLALSWPLTSRAIAAAQPADLERFWTKVDHTDNCWLWRAQLGHNGYGIFWVNGTSVRAHRFIYETTHGTIEDRALTIDHLCRTRHCVNPAHMELVTRGENVRRGEAGSNHRGKTHCKNGHPFDATNTVHWGRLSKHRVCRACKADHRRRLREKRRRALSLELAESCDA